MTTPDTQPIVRMLRRLKPSQLPSFAVMVTDDEAFAGSRGEIAAYLRANDLGAQAHTVQARKVPRGHVLLVIVDDVTGLTFSSLCLGGA